MDQNILVKADSGDYMMTPLGEYNQAKGQRDALCEESQVKILDTLLTAGVTGAATAISLAGGGALTGLALLIAGSAKTYALGRASRECWREWTRCEVAFNEVKSRTEYRWSQGEINDLVSALQLKSGYPFTKRLL